MTITEFAKKHKVTRWRAERAAHWAFKKTGDKFGPKGRGQITQCSSDAQRLMVEYLSRSSGADKLQEQAKEAALFDINLAQWVKTWTDALMECEENDKKDNILTILGGMRILETQKDFLQRMSEGRRPGDTILYLCLRVGVDRTNGEQDGWSGFTKYLQDCGFDPAYGRED